MKRIILALVSVTLWALSMAQPQVVMLGDSNTWIGGDDCSNPRGWNYWFAQEYQPSECRSYARSGATWTNTERTVKNSREDIAVLGDNNVIYNQIVRLIEAVDSGRQATPDIIIIGAGTNDAWFAKQRPDVFSRSVEEVFADVSDFIIEKPVHEVRSLAEAVRYNCEMLMDRFPKASIVLLTTIQTPKAAAERVRKAADVIRDSGAMMSVPVISLDREGGIYTAAEKRGKVRTYDGAHTNEFGARRHGHLVAERVKMLFPDMRADR